MSDYADVAAEATENLEPAGDPGEAGAAAAPAPAVPDGTGDVAPSSGEGAAPTWTGVTQEEWQQTQQLLQQLSEQNAAPAVPQFDPFTGQPLQGAKQTPELPEPWDPDYSQKMAEYLDWRDQRAQDQMRPFLEPAVLEHAQQDMSSSVERAASAIGFDVADKPQRVDAVAAVASALLNVPENTPENAYAMAAQFISELVKGERDAGVSEYKESLLRPSGQPEPGATGSGISAPGPADSYAAIAELYATDPGAPENAFR